MAGNLRTLSVSIVAKTHKLKSGVDQAKRHITGLNKSMRLARTAATAMNVALGGLAVGGISMIVRRSIDAADRLSKLSTRLGETTKQLQGLEFAARRSGITNQTLEMGLQRMVRRVSEAAQGLGEAKGALKELNLEASVLTKLSLNQQFNAIADAISRVQEPADKVRLAMKLFDSEGVRLLQLMKDGSKGVESLKNELFETGTVLEENTIKRLVELNDELETFTTNISNALTNSVGAAAKIGNIVTDKISEGLKLMVDLLPSMTTEFAVGLEIANKFGNKIDTAAESTKILKENIEDGTLKLINFNREAKVLSGQRFTPTQHPENDLLVKLAEIRSRSKRFSVTPQAIEDTISKRFVPELTDDLEKMQRAADMATNALSQGLHAAFGDVTNLDGALKRMLTTLSNQILSEFIISPFARALGSALFAPIAQGLAGGGFSGNNVGVASGPGPEAVLPLRSISSGTLGNSGSGNPSVIMNVTTPDADSFRRSEGQVLSGMRRAISRGGQGNLLY